MSNILPTINPAALGYVSFRPFPDVQPFSIRSGATYDSILETIRVWLRDELVPYLANNSATAIFQENSDLLVDTVNAALVTQSGSVTNAVNTAVATIIASGITVQDPVVSGIVGLSPAPLGGGANDTDRLNTWLTANAGKTLTFRPGTYSTTGLTIPANTTVNGYTAKFVARPGSTHGFLLNTGSKLAGIEYDGAAGTDAGAFGVWSNPGVIGVVIRDCNVHHMLNVGVGIDTGHDCYIIDNIIHDIPTNNGIYVAFSDRVTIARNHLTATNGIEVWGGDGAQTPGYRGCKKIKVDDNVCQGGGIFLAAVEDFTINNNYSLNGPDVGVDAESCSNGTMNNNVIRDAVNFGISLFYGCVDVAITGNTVQRSNNGSGNKVGVGIVTNQRSTGITITGNSISVPSHGIFTDNESLSDSVIVGNKILAGYPILLANSYEMIVSHNRLMSYGSRAIGIEGSYNCMIQGNRIIKIGSDGSIAGQDGGIWVYNRGGAYQGGGNQIQHNKVNGFISDICLHAAKNMVRDNTCQTLMNGSGLSQNIANNFLVADPSSAVSTTVV